ncbi:hypothetical protein OHU11_33715 [Streptomyces sp. NBC_00257]|nr:MULTISPECIES: hypothetical protein [unclassified Streptomyces]WTB53466.1 hypothetical protein OG832_09980 [Streptomyces sp. NBC_00826]WTH93643.1 hypothetical protein OIC43_33705 [Streptomyces sp. NBC_00825]WTI02377.1 hypothetical protein OHA23_33685 [Streptomyces sp. NBC_00822]MCX4868007.1 hypothetical protein [Streptomyces sp. NBC_00906]MCX4899245.1 hypothetical protein [Streptomyces sp. NBC_00892]
MSLTSDPPIDKATGPRRAAPADGHNTPTSSRSVLRHHVERHYAKGSPR